MPDKRIGLDAVSHALGIGSAPESWPASWRAYREWVRGGGCEALNWEVPANAGEVFDLPDECVAALEDIFKSIRANHAFRELAGFWHYVVYHLPEGMERNTNVWNLPDRIGGHSNKLLQLAAIASGADHALANFAATGVSAETAAITLGYIGRYARDIKDRRGVWGLESMGWLSNYARAGIFRLGRLTFKAGHCGLQFRAFANRDTGEVTVLCEATDKYRADGLADGTNDISDPDAWTPVLEIGEDTIVGHPVTADCTAQREPISLPADQWRQVMAPGDEIVEVHIAGGSKMAHDECVEAYRLALDFFPGYYPSMKFAGFTCWSWLLDPNLAKILPPEANIVRFQRDFHQLPVPADEGQAYDLVFGDSSIDPTRVTPTTSLQRAIVEYVTAGHRLRSAGGIITWAEAETLAS